MGKKSKSKTAIAGTTSKKDSASSSATPRSIHADLDPLPADLLNVEEEVPSKVVLRCFGCYKYDNPKILRCACKCTYFCSKECQRESWGRHKEECVSIRAHFKEEQEEQRKHLELAATLIAQEASPSSSFTCSVCLDEKDEDQNTLLLPCGHRFCYPCIREVQYNDFFDENVAGACPQCRAPLPHLEHIVASRVRALTQVAHLKQGQDRDEVCRVAMKLLDFILEQEPGRAILQRFKGKVYTIMEAHDQAVVCFKKSYHVHKTMFEHVLSNPSGVVAPGEEYDKSMQEYRNLTTEEVATDFPSDMGDLETEITPACAMVENAREAYSELFLELAMASLQCATDDNEKVAATQLVLFVQKINKPFSGCRLLDLACTKALAECYVALGHWEKASALVKKAIARFRYHSGWHMIMVESEMKQGNFEKALVYAAKGYFYEEAWNEDGTRAKNLQLWKDIGQSMLKQQENGEAK